MKRKDHPSRNEQTEGNNITVLQFTTFVNPIYLNSGKVDGVAVIFEMIENLLIPKNDKSVLKFEKIHQIFQIRGIKPRELEPLTSANIQQAGDDHGGGVSLVAAHFGRRSNLV